MLRFLFTILVIAVTALPLLALMLTAVIAGLFSKEAGGRIAQFGIKVYSRLVLWASGCKVTVKGTQNVPEDETVLFVSNHRGAFDILLAYGYTPKRLAFISKKEWKSLPVINVFIVITGGLFLDRENIKEGLKTILEAIERVKNGLSIWVCPEGTRNRDKDARNLLPFKAGSFKIASKSGCRVLPVAMIGTGEIFDKFRITPQHLTIEYGVPERISELSQEDSKHPGDYFAGRIKEMICRNIENE